MTTTNKQLAEAAREIAARSDGVQKVAANCLVVALGYSPSVAVARSALGELARSDVRRAALELLDQLAAERGQQ